jgi:hypothetical protein
MARLVITKVLEDNVYSVTFSVDNISTAEANLVTAFGDPTVDFGGTYDINGSTFLSTYFPTSQHLIDDWVQYTDYDTSDEVQYTDGFYYRAKSNIRFSTLADWTARTDYFDDTWDGDGTAYSPGDVVYRSGEFYTALLASGSPVVDPAADSSPATWQQTDVVKKYTDNNYYRLKIPTEFANVTVWDSETRYFSSGQSQFTTVTANVVQFTDNNYYKCIQDSPAAWNAASTYSTGDLVQYSEGSPSVNYFYKALQDIDTASPDITPGVDTDYWAITNTADPISDSGNYWELFTDFDPTQDGGTYWELYTRLDPPSSTYWQIFTPSGTDPESTADFTVNEITRGIASLATNPLTYTFDSTVLDEAEENANDLIVVVKYDVNLAWDTFLLNSDGFSGDEIYPLT